jgi:antitoxin VapB
VAYTITDPHIVQLARELAQLTGEPLDAALANAIRERLARARAGAIRAGDLLTAPTTDAPRLDSVADVQRFVATLPVLDDRPADDLLYDEHGLPR